MKTTRDMREEILNAAFKVFGNNGFGSTTIKDIALEAGIAPGSIYNHFSDKEDLFRSTVQQGWDKFLDKLQSTFASSMTMKEKYRNFIDLAFDLLKKSQPLLKGMFFAANQRELVRDKIQKIVDYLMEFFKEGKIYLLIKTFIDEKQRRFYLELTIMGILLKISLCSPLTVDEELGKMKSEIYRLIEKQT
ncbi:MAG: TetR/AcrR family transcriptional regulator [Spirochaetales bacterium]|nr:TetR/AcrR family transcriptional regulator [Spirochaetales bacterium]